MSDNELPTVAPKDAVCYIDFEFQLPFYESLMDPALVKECLLSATNEVLSPKEISLPSDAIQVSDVDHRAQTKRVKVGGWVTCKDQQRSMIEEALRIAQKGKKISKQIADRTDIKRTRISIQQFTTKFSNEQHVNRPFIKNQFEHWQKQRRTHSLQSNDDAQEKKEDDNNNNENKSNDANDDKNNNEDKNNTEPQNDQEEDEEEPPLTHLNEGGASVVVHDDVDHEEYALIAKEVTSKTSTDESSFQMVDMNDETDHSSNEEQKARLKDKLGIDLDTYADVDAESGDDYRSITPTVPGMDTLGISPVIKSKDAKDDEAEHLRLELVKRNTEHQSEVDHLQNVITALKSQNNLQRKKSRISMKIDDAIMKKQLQQQTNDEVSRLEKELYTSREAKDLELQRVRLRHQAELKNFEIQLRQTQQHHALELQNIRKTHQLQTHQMQQQIRGLTGTLERESEKDKEIFDLKEEMEQIKANMGSTIQNYENVIAKLNAESEENIRREIDKRIKETAQFKRDINDLRQTLKREETKRSRLQGEVKQLQDENQQKDSVINKMKNMFVNEKKKAASLERKLMKSKRNVHIPHSKEEIQNEKNTENLARGKHLRKKSNKFQNRTVTMRQLDTGDAVIEIEKTGDMMDSLQDVVDFATNYDVNLDTDSEFEENDEEADDINGGSDEEIALKDQQIAGLKEKVRNLREKIDALQEEKAEEVQLLQQKIGSLQQKMEMEDENFMTQNQMLEFKLKQKENNAQKLQDDLRQLQREHRKEIRIFNESIEKYKDDLIEKEREIQTLGENLDLVEDENARLKDMEDQLAAEMEEIEEDYETMLTEMKEDTAKQWQEVVQQRDEETETWKMKAHQQSKSIAELQLMVDDMQKKEIHIMNHDIEEEEERKEEENERVEDEAVQEEEIVIDDDADDIQWKGQMQAEPQQEQEEEEEQIAFNKEDYVLIEDMNQRIDEMQMKHKQQINKTQNEYQDKYKNMENELKNNIDILNSDNSALKNEVNDSKANIDKCQSQLDIAEKSRLALLERFMQEMDRMRDEIRKLNASRRSQT